MTTLGGRALPSVATLGVCYAVAAVPFQDYLMIGGVSHSQLATAVLAVAVLLHWLLHRPLVLPVDRTGWARLAVLTALVLATGFSPYGWRNGVDEIRRWGIALAVGYLVAVVPRDRRDVQALVLVLCLAPAAAALYALIQSMRGIGPAAFVIPGLTSLAPTAPSGSRTRSPATSTAPGRGWSHWPYGGARRQHAGAGGSTPSPAYSVRSCSCRFHAGGGSVPRSGCSRCSGSQVGCGVALAWC